MRLLALLLLLPACGAAPAEQPDAAAADAATAPDAAADPRPIKYVLVIVKENHTFDNYFADYDGDVDKAKTAALADGGSRPLVAFPPGPLSIDPLHSRTAALIAFNDGGMNGFGEVPANNGDPTPFGYFPAPAVALYHHIAHEFVLFDHFFTNTLGPSFPGHLATIAGWAPAVTNPYCVAQAGCNPPFPSGNCDFPTGWKLDAFDFDTCSIQQVAPCFDIPTVIDALPAPYTWRTYGDTDNGRTYTPFRAVRSTGASPAVRDAHYRDIKGLVADLAAGEQANVTYAHIEGVNSEHPPEDICPGEQYTAAILNAAMKGPHWSEMAVVLTWDDWGGFYDHVRPEVRRCATGDFAGPGFRVPTLILSPYARRDVVLHLNTEQASIPRLVEELFDLPFMADREPHARDREAGSLLGAFDFQQTPRSPVPLEQVCP